MPLTAVLIAALACSFVSFASFVSFTSFVSFDSSPQKKPSVTVYVFAADVPGAPKEENAAREEAVSDMRDALRKKAGLEIVDTRAGADVLVEVVGREEREGSEAASAARRSPRWGR